MLSRRPRIKGIANINIRRKPEVPNADNSNSTDQLELVSSEISTNDQTPIKDNKNDDSSKLNADIINENILEIQSNNNIAKETNQTNLNDSDKCKNLNNETDTLINNSVISVSESNNNDIIKNGEQTIITNGQNQSDSCKETNPNKIDTKPPIRRWAPKPKPTISFSSALRRAKSNIVALAENLNTTTNQNVENEKPSDSSESLDLNTHLDNGPSGVTNESAIEPYQSNLNTSEKLSQTPLSPNKIINRSRIKPMPKLIRRNSVQGSASESEDDNKRTYNRIRNDSVCSTNSISTETTNVPSSETNTLQKPKLTTIKVERFFRRSDQSRKVAEARKNFYSKFGSNVPDKKRLTMMDLIYYNPTSNPMSKKKPNSEKPKEVIQISEETVDDNPDDPKSEDEECAPVPQVKVGPNGEIILDEQSLVIEQTGAKKAREQLANTEVINDDDLDRSYGIFKRPKRSKEWTAIETLRFYRSLNTVGTDFSLMLSLFPGRTRRELKVKFKKEEKINRHLIDKALTNPVDFDLSELEKQAKQEEELEMIKKENELKKKLRMRRCYRRHPSGKLSKLMGEENTANVRKKPKKEKKDLYNILENGLDDLMSELESNSDEEENDDNDYDDEQDEDDVVPCKISKPNTTPPRTRSSRKVEINATPEIMNKDDDEQTNNNFINHNGIVDSDDDVVDENDDDDDDNNDDNRNTNTDVGLNMRVNEETQEVDIFDEHQANETLIKQITATSDNNNKQQNDSSTNEDENSSPTLEKFSEVEPGSLMIMSSKNETGDTVFKVYMMSKDQSMVEVNLSLDVVQSLTNSLGKDDTIDLDLPVIEINNSETVNTNANKEKIILP